MNRGWGGLSRLVLPLAAVAALLLIPSTASAANPPAKVILAGSGFGKVLGKTGNTEGNPRLECSNIPGEILTECEVESGEDSGLKGLTVEEIPGAGSEFVEWEILSGNGSLGCTNLEAPVCGVITFGEPIEIKATFNKIPLPKFTLTTSTSGTAGSVECKIDGGAQGPCPEGVEEVEEESDVELIAVSAAESDFAEWTSGPCEGSSSATCSFEMEGDTSANAAFVIASENLTINNEGVEGAVECQVNGGGFASCSGTTAYSYGDEIDVTAAAAAEHKLVSLVGTGSAGGAACEAESETTGSCHFTIEADSEVTATFEPAGTKAQVEVETVNGKVPITTSLEGGCGEEGVYLGEFLPGVNANYVNNCSVVATSTGGSAELSAADLTGEAPIGHLIQGSYSLPDALETRANGGSYESLDPGPVSLVTYSEPVSADNVNVSFRQHIGLHDGLHTGPYSKTITLTLEQTSP
jgi:hypothetical protein